MNEKIEELENDVEEKNSEIEALKGEIQELKGACDRWSEDAYVAELYVRQLSSALLDIMDYLNVFDENDTQVSSVSRSVLLIMGENLNIPGDILNKNRVLAKLLKLNSFKLLSGA